MRSVGLSIMFVAALFVCVCAQSFDVSKADSIAELYPGHSLSDLGLLSFKLTNQLATDLGKFRAIYKWVCLNVESDFDLMQLAKKKRLKLSGVELDRWNRKFHFMVVRKLLNEHKTMCTGYAWIVRELAIRAGLDCEILHGYGRQPNANIGNTALANHSWNAVMLNGKWYLCDPTWSSGFVSPANQFTFNFKEEYFLSDPAKFVRNHLPLDPKWTLLDNAPSLEYFLNAPLIYVTSYSFDFNPVYPSSFRIEIQRDKPVCFNYTKGNDINSKRMMLMIDSHPAAATFDCNQVTYSFHDKGKYAVHLLIDKQPVVSYEVTVK